MNRESIRKALEAVGNKTQDKAIYLAYLEQIVDAVMALKNDSDTQAAE